SNELRSFSKIVDVFATNTAGLSVIFRRSTTVAGQLIVDIRMERVSVRVFVWLVQDVLTELPGGQVYRQDLGRAPAAFGATGHMIENASNLIAGELAGSKRHQSLMRHVFLHHFVPRSRAARRRLKRSRADFRRLITCW